MSDRERLLATKSVSLDKKKCFDIVMPNYFKSQDQLNNMITLLETLLKRMNEDLTTHTRHNNLESNKHKGTIRAIIENEIINQQFEESKECRFKPSN